eukprot:gene13123-14471_t
MPDKIAPKAHRNKLHGYKLWKEGYISNVEVKSNVLTDNLTLYLVKSNVSASMKSIKYVVYCHLNQKTGDVIHAKCNCKAGAGGCCKHVAALLYTLLDYSNLELSYVPETVTCTQVLQKWSVPGKKLDSSVAVKFNDLVFEKSNFTRDKCMTRKKPPVNGSRDNYCATPMFGRTISRDTIRNMADALEKAGQATLLAQTLKGNDCIASSFYFSSINPWQKMVSEEIPNEPSPINEPERLDIFMEMSATFDDRLIPNESTKETIAQNVCISLSKARLIEEQTREQSQSRIWFFERICKQSVDDSSFTPSVCMPAAVCLKNGSRRITAVQLIISIMLQHSGFMKGVNQVPRPAPLQVLTISLTHIQEHLVLSDYFSKNELRPLAVSCTFLYKKLDKLDMTIFMKFVNTSRKKTPLEKLLGMENGLCLPDTVEYSNQRKDYIVLCGRIAVKYITCLQSLANSSVKCIKHPYSNRTSEQTNTIFAEMIYEDENQSSSMQNIMTHLHAYMPHKIEDENDIFGKQGIVGDQLTVE